MLFVLLLPLVVRMPSHPIKGVGATYYPQYSEQMAIMGITHVYNWGPQPGAGGVGVHDVFWPMVFRLPVGWCPELYPADVVLLGNEPDLKGQGNQSPYEFARGLRQMEACYPARRLVAFNTQNLEYVSQTLDIYTRLYGHQPRLWALGVHCYGWLSADAAETLCRDTLTEALAVARAWNMEGIVVTEIAYPPCWSCQDGAAPCAYGLEQSARFIGRMARFCAETDGCLGFFPFQLWMEDTEPWAFGEWCSTKLVNDDGSLTLLGEAYREW